VGIVATVLGAVNQVEFKMNYVKANLIYVDCDHHTRRRLLSWSI